MKKGIKERPMKCHGHYKFVLTDVNTGQEEIFEYDNLVPSVALNALAQQMAGSNSAEVEVTYFAFGTGNNTPSLSDTTLQSETNSTRKLIQTRSASGSVTTLTTFFNTGEANGTWKEAAVFGDGAALTASGTIDSGIMFSRVLVNITKTVSKTLSVFYTFTFS